jgi:hypothetical protein
MARTANSTPPRVLVGMAVMSLGVLYLVASNAYTSERFWILANTVVACALLVGGLLISSWGDPKPPGVAKRVALVLAVSLAAFAIIGAILYGYI